MKSRVLTLAAVCVFFVSRAACRQMCLSCQYVANSKREGVECSSSPWNWTFGSTRMRCNFRCTIEAHFDKKSGDPTYFYRGCTPSNDAGEDGCHDDEVKEYCSYSCVDDDYCNDRAFLKSPSVEAASGAVRGRAGLPWLLHLLFLLIVLGFL